MSLPNILTLSRIPLMLIIVTLMFQHWLGAASLAFWFFIAAAISDWLDGYIARKRKIVTTFGKLMDALTDKIMVIGIMIGLVDADSQFLPLPYPFVYLVVITMTREFLVSGMRMVAASKGVVVSADRGGKTKTVTQLIAIGFLLATPMVGRDWAYFMPWELSRFTGFLHSVGVMGFVIGTFLAVWSGWRYISQYKNVVFTADDR